MAIELIDTLAPKNGGSFPMVMGEDVEIDGQRLPEILESIEAAAGDIEAATPGDIDALFPEQSQA